MPSVPRGRQADEHRHILGRDAADGLVHLLHRGRATDDAIDGVIRRSTLFVDGRHPAQAAQFDGARNDRPQLMQIDWLEQVLERPSLHRLDRGLGGCVSGDDYQRQTRVDAPDRIEGVQPGHVAEAHIENDHVRPLLSD